MKQRLHLAQCLCTLVLAVIAGAVSMSASAQMRVIDSFEVGENVYVRALALDRKRGALWVGTSVGAIEVDLNTLKPRNTFTRNDGLANEYVFAVGLDAQGNTWFGTNAGGASRYNDGKWKTYFPMHGLADYWIYAFAQQKSGPFWIGTWAGASRFDPKTGKFTNFVKELVNEWVYGLAIDSRDRVWFGTEGGVSLFDGTAWRSWTHKDGLGAPNVKNQPPSVNTGLGTRQRHDLSTLREGTQTYNPSYVFAVHVSPDDTVWAGTWGGGVSRFDGKRWSNYSAQDGLAGDIVYSIAQDKSGALWFGTNNGVSRFDGKRWTSLSKAQGLLDNHVYALAIASEREAWIATKGGVVRVRSD